MLGATLFPPCASCGSWGRRWHRGSFCCLPRAQSDAFAGRGDDALGLREWAAEEDEVAPVVRIRSWYLHHWHGALEEQVDGEWRIIKWWYEPVRVGY